MLDPYLVIGFIGALVLMVGFLMNQIGRWQTSDFEYDFINLVGAAILTIYSWQIASFPFLVLFAVWTLFSLKDVFADGFQNIRKGKKEKAEMDTMDKGEENKSDESTEETPTEE